MRILNNIEDIKLKFPTLDAQLVKKVIETSNLEIGKRLLKGDDFLMPCNLGILIIGKFKGKRVFDYIHWCKTGEKKPKANLSTFGYIYKTMWFKGLVSGNKKSLTNNLYKFKASRYEISRPLSQLLNRGEDYYKDEEYINKYYYRKVNKTTSK